MTAHRFTRTLAALLLGLLGASLQVQAQGWPSRPVKIVIPVAAAGAMDPLARAVAARLSEMWKQPVLVENRVGANGIIGADYVSKAEPDGYTLLMSEASPFVMSPHLYRTMPYDGLASFTPIMLVSRVPWVIGINAAVPATTLQEFVALAKAQPGKLAYGSIGLGSSVHIRVEQLKQALGIDLNHVPYKGAGPAMNDLLGGQLAMIMITPGLVEPHVRTGKLRMLAATTPERLAGLREFLGGFGLQIGGGEKPQARDYAEEDSFTGARWLFKVSEHAVGVRFTYKRNQLVDRSQLIDTQL
jgi:tripartite-type tricarboxylate transporter receptor subunit TctC